jgi:diacylglycerol kinase family enzyme
MWTGAREAGADPVKLKIKVDGSTWFSGSASCVLVGNVSSVFGGVHLFDDAQPDDGWLDVGVSTAVGSMQWARTLARVSASKSQESPFIRITRARRISIKLRKPLTYELDGGARRPTRKVKVRVIPGAVKVCVPESSSPAGN